MARKQPADPRKYEGKRYLDFEESADFLGLSRSTVLRYINDERIQTYKFYRDKKRYIAIEDVERIQKLMEEPWERRTPDGNEEVRVEGPKEQRSLPVEEAA